jgi:uncharacterized membrane protein YidH (DUF202 family)
MNQGDHNPEELEPDEYPELPLPPTDLRLLGALARTAYSSEQTLMSWIRSALSLCTFGFSIAQFFRFLEQQGAAGAEEAASEPRQFGISLIVVGVVVLVMATIEHFLRIRELKTKGLPSDYGSMLPICSAAALIALGLTAFLTIYFNWLNWSP